MEPELFKRLVENIERDGRLTSVPFAALDAQGRYEVLSGNHRVRAAKQAGLEEIDVMVTDDFLTKAQRVAIQLSHNSLAGQDDMALLKDLYDGIDEVDWRAYAGLDDRTLALLDQMKLDPLSDAGLRFQTIQLVFLPDEVEQLEAALEQARALLQVSRSLAVRFEDYDRFLDGLLKAGQSYDVTNAATLFSIILEVFERNQHELSEGWEEVESKSRWVPLASIFGTDTVPLEAARVMLQAVKKMRKRDEVSEKALWQTIEFWAADYLAGSE